MTSEEILISQNWHFSLPFSKWNIYSDTLNKGNFFTNTGITLYSMYCTSIMKIFCLFKHALNVFWKKNCLKTGFYAKNINLLGKVDFIPLNCGHLDQNYYFEKASVRYFDSVQRKSRITVKWRCCNFSELFFALNYHI